MAGFERTTGILFLRFVLGRLLSLAVTVLISSFVIFSALYLAPGSAISFLTQGRSISPEALTSLNKQYHLDDPFLTQYMRWLSGALRGDFGKSIIYREDVRPLLTPMIVNSALLILCAAAIILLIGLASGIIAGLYPGRLDTFLMLGASAALAIPAFVAAAALTWIFGVELGWLPVFGPGTGLAGRLQHLILPAVALSLAPYAYVSRLTRTSVRQELAAEHVQTAVSRGLRYPVVVRRHVLRNAAIPVVTVGGLTIAGLIAGSVVVEQVFQLSGLGSNLVSAVQQKDFPVVQAICFIYVTTFIVLNTLIDLTYSFFDPRITSGRGRA